MIIDLIRVSPRLVMSPIAIPLEVGVDIFVCLICKLRGHFTAWSEVDSVSGSRDNEENARFINVA